MAFMFEKLDVYQKTIDFVDHPCALTEGFPRGYGFLADQLNRAALSIATNLAEGNGRFTKADRKNFFIIARGSVQERVPLLKIARRRGLLHDTEHGNQPCSSRLDRTGVISDTASGTTWAQFRKGKVTMPQDIRVWQVGEGDSLSDIQRSMLNDEARIEKWLEEDISILSGDLLVIGRQVRTAYGGFIDLLCIDRKGDLVIVELKRDKTPREITAQALDYASWVSGLSHEDVTQLADSYLKDRKQGTLEDVYREKFDADLPDVLNEGLEMLVVGSEIDASSERIMKFLSERYGVAINAATFQHFKTDDGKELLARAFLMEPDRIIDDGGSKRKRLLTYRQLEDMADDAGVRSVYDKAVELLAQVFEHRGTTQSTLVFSGDIKENRRTILHLVPSRSDSGKGLVVHFYKERLATYLSTDSDQLLRNIPVRIEQSGGRSTDTRGFLPDVSKVKELAAFIKGRRAKQHP